MRPPGPIADYLAALARELRFDPALARRTGREVEDHLWEATAANGDSSMEAQARAVLCQEGARAPCCTRDEGGPFGAVL